MDHLPEALRALSAYKQFILWIPVPLPNGKITKKPINYQTGLPHNPHDPAIWLDDETAIAFSKKLNINCGIGFVFTKADPFWFLDIDSCLLPDNTWSPLSVALCNQLQGCAVEISQSGKGLHIFGTGPVPEHGCKNGENGLEFYTDLRFVALTGTGAQGDAAFSPQADVLNRLVSGYFPPNETGDVNFIWTSEPVSEWCGPEDDDELIKKILTSGNNNASSVFGNRATVQDLWTGNISALSESYPHPDKPFDHSSADAALCSHLAFWTGKNAARIDRLFNKSALVRDKWTTREDYRQRTITHAIKNCKAVYNVGTKPEKEPVSEIKFKSGHQFVNPEQQAELFKGCVYVQHDHRIFVPGGQLLKPEQFKVTYGGYVYNLDSLNEKTTTNAWEVFTESQVIIFPKVNNTCFRPDLTPGEIIKEEDRTIVNTYVPIETKKIKGDPAPFLDLIYKLFPDDTDRNIILAYIAAVVQYPGVKFQWAPLIQGCEGNGKSLIMDAIEYAVGKRYTHKPKAESIHNQFNAWLAGKLFIGVEEVYINDSRHKIDALKWMITNKRGSFEPKGVDEYTGDNRANFMCASNHKDAIRVARKNNRRWCIFFTPQQNEDDIISWGMGGKYFPNLYAWAEREGFAIINNYLQEYQIPDELNPAKFCVRAPVTTSTEDAIAAGLGMIEQEIVEAIEQGRPGFAKGWVSSMAIDRFLAEKHIKISLNKRRDIIQELGYVLHPALNNGRTNVELPTEGGKPRLYIKKGHIHANLTAPNEVVRHYLESQGVISPGDKRSFLEGERS